MQTEATEQLDSTIAGKRVVKRKGEPGPPRRFLHVIYQWGKVIHWLIPLNSVSGILKQAKNKPKGVKKYFEKWKVLINIKKGYINLFLDEIQVSSCFFLVFLFYIY